MASKVSIARPPATIEVPASGVTDTSSVTDTHLRRGTAQFRRARLALFAGSFITYAVMYGVQPLLPTYAQEFHISPAETSLCISVTTTALAIAVLIAGSLAEAWGRKPLMTVSLFAIALLAMLGALAPTFPALLAVRALQGVMLAGVPAIAMAYLSEEVYAPSLGYAMGAMIGGNSVGSMSGRILIGVVTDITSWRIALAVLGGIGLVCAISFWRMLPPSRHFEPRPLALGALGTTLVRHLGDPGLLSLYGIGFLLMGSFVTLFNYISFHLSAPPYHLPQSLIRWIYLLYLIGAFASTWMGYLADRVGRQHVLWAGVLIMLGGAVVTLTDNLPSKIVGVAIFTFGFWGAHSIASSWVGRRAAAQKAQASALYLFFFYVGASLGGTTGGYVWTWLGWPGVIGLIGVFLVVAFAITLRLSALPSAAPRAPYVHRPASFAELAGFAGTPAPIVALYRDGYVHSAVPTPPLVTRPLTIPLRQQTNKRAGFVSRQRKPPAEANVPLFYICGGDWHSAWPYEPVAHLLEKLGYPVHVFATAGPELQHPPAGVTREFVVRRHLEHIRAHDLHNLVVVAWSYGGWIAQLLADELLLLDEKRPEGAPRILRRVIIFDGFVLREGQDLRGILAEFDHMTGSSTADFFRHFPLDLDRQVIWLPEQTRVEPFLPAAGVDAAALERPHMSTQLRPHPLATLVLPAAPTDTARFWQAVNAGELPVSYIVANRDPEPGSTDFWRWEALHILQVRHRIPSRLFIEADISHEAWIIPEEHPALVQALLQAEGIPVRAEQIPAPYADAQAQAQQVADQLNALMAYLGA